MPEQLSVSVSLYPGSLNQLVFISARFNTPLQEVLHDVIVNGVSRTINDYEARSGGAKSHTYINSPALAGVR